MSRSLIQTANQSPQTVALNGIIAPGSVLRRYGCNCRLSGNAHEIIGEGYYKITGAVSVTPTAAGPVTVALYEDGVQIPGAIAYGSVSTAGNPVTLTLVTTVRMGCCCDTSSMITAVLLDGPGVVNNYSLRIDKD